MIRIVKRETGSRPLPATSAPFDRHTQRQQEIISREVESVKTAIPRLRDWFIEYAEDLAAEVSASPSSAKRIKYTVIGGFAGVHPEYAQHVLNYPGYEGSGFFATELSVRITEKKGPELIAGYHGQRHENRLVVNPSCLDGESNHWEAAWENWCSDLRESADPELEWDSDSFLMLVAPGSAYILQQFQQAYAQRCGFVTQCAVPYSLVKSLLGNPNSASESWPTESGTIVRSIRIQGDATTPHVVLTLDESVRPGRTQEFDVPTSSATRDWAVLLNEDRWNDAYRRWACME